MIKLEAAFPKIKSDFSFDEILNKFIETLREYAISITHRDTGAWAGAHRSEVVTDTARVYIDPTATNPRTGTPVEFYASVWEARGGELSVYERTIAENSVLIDALEEEIISEVLL